MKKTPVWVDNPPLIHLFIPNAGCDYIALALPEAA
jgi:hypothetical protein